MTSRRAWYPNSRFASWTSCASRARPSRSRFSNHLAPMWRCRQTPATVLAAYAAALGAYRERRFEAAAGIFESLRQHSDDLLYNVYLDRIRNFRQSPPPDDWDGVFEHQNK